MRLKTPKCNRTCSNGFLSRDCGKMYKPVHYVDLSGLGLVLDVLLPILVILVKYCTYEYVYKVLQLYAGAFNY